MIAMEVLLKIIELKGNSKTLLANELLAVKPDLKLTASYINNWIYRDKKIPAEWIIPLAEVSGFKFTPHQLSSALYPHKDDGLPTSLRGQCN